MSCQCHNIVHTYGPELWKCRDCGKEFEPKALDQPVTAVAEEKQPRFAILQCPNCHKDHDVRCHDCFTAIPLPDYSAPKEEQKGCDCDPQFCHLCSKCPCSCHKSLQYPDSTGIGYCPSKSDFPQEKEDSCSTEPCLKDCKHEFGIERYDSNGILQYKECGICFKRQSPLKDYYTKSEVDDRMKAIIDICGDIAEALREGDSFIAKSQKAWKVGMLTAKINEFKSRYL